MRKISIVTVFAVVSMCGSLARADVFLVGFDLYSSNSNGSVADPGYRYTSNSNDGGLAEILTPTSPAGASQQTKAISFHLAGGANTFSLAPPASFSPGSFAGVELFFNSTGVSFNPTDKGHAGDLVAFVPTTGGAFSMVPAGTQVLDYGAGGGSTPYGGGSTVNVGGQSVSLTALSLTTAPGGSMSINVSPAAAVPEPSTLVLSGLASFAGLGLAWLRRRKASAA